MKALHVKLLLLSSCIVTLLFLSCTKETKNEKNSIDTASNLLTDSELAALDVYVNGPSLSEDEVMENARYIMSYLDNNTTTKGATMRHISNVRKICKGNGTKSEESALVYIVNYGDSLGYAVLSADRRTDDILVLSPSGELNLENLEQDYYSGLVPEAALFLLSNLEQYLQEQINASNDMLDSLTNSALNKLPSSSTKSLCADLNLVIDKKSILLSPEDDSQQDIVIEPVWNTTVSDWEKDDAGSIPPMINVHWGQSDPYNRKTPTENGKHTLVGCVATAMAQLMTYWSYPDSYNWQLLKRYPYITKYSPASVIEEVSRLMLDAGKGVDMDYGLSGSGAYTKDAIKYFKKIGYKNPGTHKDFNEADVLNSLYSHCPVLAHGFAKYTDHYLNLWLVKIKLFRECNEGHCWVLDGVLRQKQTTTVTCDNVVVSTSTTYRSLLHCNFGWYEYCDGYYASKAFDTNKGPITKSGELNGNGEKGNYQYKLGAVCNISAY